MANPVVRIKNAVRSSRLAKTVNQLLGRSESLKDLPYILDQAKAALTLSEKITWLESLLDWVRSETTVHHELETNQGQLHNVRVRFLLQLLDRNVHWKAAVAEIIRAIIKDTSAVHLFCLTGLAQESGFFSEGANRVLKRVLPVPPHDNDFAEAFARFFRSTKDAIWIKHISTETFEEILNLIQYGNESQDLFDSWQSAISDSLLILSSNVASQGLSIDVRSRLPGVSVSTSPFLLLNQKLIEQMNRSDGLPFDIHRFAKEFQPIIDNCRNMIQDVLKHLEVSGVSVNLVYRLESITHWINRIEVLLKLTLLEYFPDRQQILIHFISDLINERLSNATLTQLIEGNLHLLSRKIVERTGASGEHYITRSRAEYVQMLQSAMGGGLLTVGTTVLKFAVSNLRFPFFFEGFFLWINYSGSFLLMQALGFTLATKQPSMTASALAGRLKNINKPEDVQDFVTEVIRITRSQFAAAIGNVGMVIPGAILLELLIRYIFGRSVIGLETAEYLVQSLHPFKSLTIPLAALTGVLLWTSSILAGWLENWIVFRQIPEALAKNRRLNQVFGQERCQGFSKWFLHSISGIGGNISLGFLLGFTPIIGRFFGLPLDVRHVTLSAGALTFALCSMIRAGVVDPWNVSFAFLGIAIIGALNFGVSFALALAVAARARNVQSIWIWYLVKIVWSRLKRAPGQFFLPPRDEEPNKV